MTDYNTEENIAFVKSFLAVHNTGVLCTTDNSNNPFGSVIYYSINDDLSINFTTKDKTKKSENIKNNSNVMLVACDEEKQTTLQIMGVAELIADPAESEVVLKKTLDASLRGSGNTIAPVVKLNAGEIITYVIKTKSIRMASYSDAEMTDYNERFITIEL